MKFELREKTGFFTNDAKVRIYTREVDLFYFKDPKKLPFHFNLPRGVYYTNNTLKETQARRYKLPMLPAKERHKKIPNNLEIVYGNNPHKASIYFEKHMILLDYGIKKLSKPQKTNIILHELAHYYYKTEKYCDLWAAREMLVQGYNPSQIFFSIYGTLNNSDTSLERKEFILTNCENAFAK